MKRLLAILISLAASLASLVAGSPTAQAHSDRPGPAHHKVVTYVALGDSYSAGVGIGHYDPASGACLRSARAYPELLDARSHRLDLIDFNACAGATTEDLIANQLPSTPNRDVDAVSVTIGGNDVGAFSVLPDCLGLDGVPGCSDTAKTLSTAALEQLLPTKLAVALAAIHTAYPRATIFVGGYMELFGNREEACKVGEYNGQPLYINTADKVWLNMTAVRLNTVIRKAVHLADNTMRARFVDVSRVFNGHGLCDFAKPWVGSFDITNPRALLHPTARGQRAYAHAFRAAGIGW